MRYSYEYKKLCVEMYRQGRSSKEPAMKKKIVQAELAPPEREEMIRLTTLAIYTQVYDERRKEIRNQMSKELYK